MHRMKESPFIDQGYQVPEPRSSITKTILATFDLGTKTDEKFNDIHSTVIKQLINPSKEKQSKFDGIKQRMLSAEHVIALDNSLVEYEQFLAENGYAEKELSNWRQNVGAAIIVLSRKYIDIPSKISDQSKLGKKL